MAVPTAITCARLLARFSMAQWGLDQLTDSAERATAELVARAVETTGIPQTHPHWSDEEVPLMGVRLRRARHSLFIEVWDTDPTPPFSSPEVGTQTGVGFPIVESISRRWNYFHPNIGGKVIWCDITIPQPSPAAGQAPEQGPPPTPPPWPTGEPVEHTQGPAVMIGRPPPPAAPKSDHV